MRDPSSEMREKWEGWRLEQCGELKGACLPRKGMVPLPPQLPHGGTGGGGRLGRTRPGEGGCWVCVGPDPRDIYKYTCLIHA